MKDSPEGIEVVSLKGDGTLYEENCRLIWTLERIDWQYLQTEKNDRYVWEWQKKLTKVSSGKQSVPGAGGRIAIADLAQGQYRMSVTGEGESRTVLEFSRSLHGDAVRLSNSDFIKLYSERDTYQSGESLKLKFDAPAAGQALIRLCAGDLLDQQVFPVKKGENEVTLKVPDCKEGSFYSALTLLRNPQSNEKLPLRLFGLLPVKLDSSSGKNGDDG